MSSVLTKGFIIVAFASIFSLSLTGNSQEPKVINIVNTATRRDTTASLFTIIYLLVLKIIHKEN